MPQAIAHRGYKAKHPENTMGAFRGAVNAKAHAMETDIHLTKDDVVVLSHVSVRQWKGHWKIHLQNCAGSNAQAMFWQRRKDHRLHLGVHKPTADTCSTSRADAQIERSTRIFGFSRAGECLAFVRHKGAYHYSSRPLLLLKLVSLTTTPTTSCASSQKPFIPFPQISSNHGINA